MAQERSSPLGAPRYKWITVGSWASQILPKDLSFFWASFHAGRRKIWWCCVLQRCSPCFRIDELWVYLTHMYDCIIIYIYTYGCVTYMYLSITYMYIWIYHTYHIHYINTSICFGFSRSTLAGALLSVYYRSTCPLCPQFSPWSS